MIESKLTTSDLCREFWMLKGGPKFQHIQRNQYSPLRINVGLRLVHMKSKNALWSRKRIKLCSTEWCPLWIGLFSQRRQPTSVTVTITVVIQEEDLQARNKLIWRQSNIKTKMSFQRMVPPQLHSTNGSFLAALIKSEKMLSQCLNWATINKGWIQAKLVLLKVEEAVQLKVKGVTAVMVQERVIKCQKQPVAKDMLPWITVIELLSILRLQMTIKGWLIAFLRWSQFCRDLITTKIITTTTNDCVKVCNKSDLQLPTGHLHKCLTGVIVRIDQSQGVLARTWIKYKCWISNFTCVNLETHHRWLRPGK